MRSKFKIANAQLALGPTNINETLPQDGEFKPSRGKAIVLPGVYYNGSRVINREQQWVWDLLIEDTATFNTLEALAYNGNTVELDTMYGEDLTATPSPTWTSYSGQVSDCIFELHEGLVFKGNKRGYRCTLVVNCHD